MKKKFLSFLTVGLLAFSSTAGADGFCGSKKTVKSTTTWTCAPTERSDRAKTSTSNASDACYKMLTAIYSGNLVYTSIGSCYPNCQKQVASWPKKITITFGPRNDRQTVDLNITVKMRVDVVCENPPKPSTPPRSSRG